MANPTLLKTPIASGGDKNTIPETTGSTTGLLSQKKGWQQINSLPINAGGIAPSRLDFNGVFNLLSNILFYAQKGWQWEFDETQNYFAGCTVKDTVDGKTYVCIADVNASTTHPSSDTTHWKLSDLATKGDLANYLPLAGGHLTGEYIIIDQNNDAGAILLMAGQKNSSEGAYLQLSGPNRSGNPGYFSLMANDGNLYKILQGKPDGTLTWDGHNVLTDSNGGYLPLAGGHLTGSYPVIDQDNDTGAILIEAGKKGTSEGAYLQLNGPNRSGHPGYFSMMANDGNLYKIFRGTPDGTLTWGGNDLGGSATVAKSIGTTGYSKRADGLIAQWGTVTNLPASQSVVPVTFPISFPNGVGSVVITSVGDYGNQRGFSWGQVKDITTSGFKLSTAASDVDSQGKNWFAIGY